MNKIAEDDEYEDDFDGNKGETDKTKLDDDKPYEDMKIGEPEKPVSITSLKDSASEDLIKKPKKKKEAKSIDAKSGPAKGIDGLDMG